MVAVVESGDQRRDRNPSARTWQPWRARRIRIEERLRGGVSGPEGKGKMEGKKNERRMKRGRRRSTKKKKRVRKARGGESAERERLTRRGEEEGREVHTRIPF